MSDQPPFPGFTRETSIRIDREGVFWHDGVRVEHPGLARAFAEWVDVDPETGRYVLKNSVNWAFITVEDAPLQVRGVEADGDHLAIVVSDGTRERLDPATVRVDEDDVPYCDVRGGRLPARFTRQAAHALLERTRDDAGALVLDLPDGKALPLRRVPRGAGAKQQG